MEEEIDEKRGNDILNKLFKNIFILKFYNWISSNIYKE